MALFLWAQEMQDEYIIVILRDTNDILYGGYDHARAHRIATMLADQGQRIKKIYKEIPDYLRHSFEGRDPAEWWTGKTSGAGVKIGSGAQRHGKAVRT